MPSEEQPVGGRALAKEAEEPLLDETSHFKAWHCGKYINFPIHLP